MAESIYLRTNNMGRLNDFYSSPNIIKMARKEKAEIHMTISTHGKLKQFIWDYKKKIMTIVRTSQ
jgi:hypothetical protein